MSIKKLIQAKSEIFFQENNNEVSWMLQSKDVIITFSNFDTKSEYFQTEKTLTGTQIKKLKLDNLSISNNQLISGNIKLKLNVSNNCKGAPIMEDFESIEKKQLPKNIIDFNSFVSKDTTRPKLNGIYLSKTGRIIATDGIIMLYRSHSAKLKNDYIILPKAIEALSILKDCTLKLMEYLSCVSSGKIKVYTSNYNINGYPDLERIIPKNPPVIFNGSIDITNADMIIDNITKLIVFKNKSIYTESGSVEVLSSKLETDYPIGVNLEKLKKCLKISGKSVIIQCLQENKPLIINKEILLLPYTNKKEYIEKILDNVK